MTEHNLFYYSHASFTNAQLPLLEVAALYFDKLYILNPADTSWATIGVDRRAEKAIKKLQDACILKAMTPADVLVKYAGPITDPIRRDRHDHEFLHLCEARGGDGGPFALAKVPQDLQTDRAMCHPLGSSARGAAYDADPFRERLDVFHRYAESGQVHNDSSVTNRGGGDGHIGLLICS
jgi:hypothetical protein